jgi:hypothetical protein
VCRKLGIYRLSTNTSFILLRVYMLYMINYKLQHCQGWIGNVVNKIIKYYLRFIIHNNTGK